VPLFRCPAHVAALLLGLVACDGGSGESEPTSPAATAEQDEVDESGCAFESLDALCDGLREHYRSSGQAWASESCALSAPQRTSGPSAEARLVGVRVGYGPVETDARVEHPVLGGTVREPPNADATTQVVLGARVGQSWFPIHIYHPTTEGERPGHQVEWSLSAGGAHLTFTDEHGAERREEPNARGHSERTLVTVRRGVPEIAARATIERWRSATDRACRRACDPLRSTPVRRRECVESCRTVRTETRSWTVTGDTVEMGATQVAQTGREGSVPGEPRHHEAQTRRLGGSHEGMRFCAFMPVARALPPQAAREVVPEVTAARARISRGSFRALSAVDAVLLPDAARSMVELSEGGSSSCGGGACTIGVRVRTIEGDMPERGVGYVVVSSGPQVDCDHGTLPSDGGSTIVEVAPARPGATVGCGFTGWDGEARRSWVVTRVLEPPSPATSDQSPI